MTMSKVDYEDIANVIANQLPLYPVDTNAGKRIVVVSLANALAQLFASQNERFNREMFLYKCGIIRGE